jgi:endo-1,4-beta-xylanase
MEVIKKVDWVLSLGLLLVGCQSSDVVEEESVGLTEQSATSVSSSLPKPAILELTSNWGSGYCAKVTINNTSSRSTVNWSIGIDLQGTTKTNGWNAKFALSNGQLTATALSVNNGLVPAGGAFSFGFCGTATTTKRPQIISVRVGDPLIPQCGNGVIETGEQCDDGNAMNNDGCSSTCTRTGLCGNGVIETGERCDDGNTMNNDGCSSTCT